MTSASSVSPVKPRSAIHPLDDFYAWNGRTLLAHEVVPADSLPEPARSLLVHERDMTRTLEQFHGSALHLRVVSRRQEGDSYWRESVLELDGTNQPVELGAIRIDLSRFPEPWRGKILEEHLPLGGILNASGILYTSRPTAFLRFQPDAFITCALHFSESVEVYGRQNALRDSAGRILAEIIEILPPPGAKRP